MKSYKQYIIFMLTIKLILALVMQSLILYGYGSTLSQEKLATSIKDNKQYKQQKPCY